MPLIGGRCQEAKCHLVASGAISGKNAKDVFEILWTEGGDPAEIIAARYGYELIGHEAEIYGVCRACQAKRQAPGAKR